MGLDASVRCRCFEEGKLSPGPVPLEDVYVDTEGYLSSRKLDAESGETIWTSVGAQSFPWMMGPLHEACMAGGMVRFWHVGQQPVETAHFKQVPCGEPDESGHQRMRIVCLDINATTEAFDSIGPEGAPKTEREFLVTSERAPFLYEGKYGTAERIRRLLVASIETGNPIRWC